MAQALKQQELIFYTYLIQNAYNNLNEPLYRYRNQHLCKCPCIYVIACMNKEKENKEKNYFI